MRVAFDGEGLIRMGHTLDDANGNDDDDYEGFGDGRLMHDNSSSSHQVRLLLDIGLS